MNYTKEELEDQVEGAIQTVRRIAEKYKTLESAYLVAMHQYHLMMNLNYPSKHISPSWRDCTEESCKEASKLISILNGGGDSIRLNRAEERISKKM